MGYWNVALSVRDFPPALVEAVGQIAFVIVLGVIFFLAIAFQFLRVHEQYGGGNSREQQINCPSCGARTSVEADTCDYCDEPIDR